MNKIAVLGAGPAGCIAAYHLQEQGHHVVLFESENKVGGRTFSFRQRGYHVDTGAGFFTNFYPTLSRTLTSLGIEKEIKALDRTTGLINKGKIGHLTLGSLRSYYHFPFLDWKDKLKMATHAAQLTATRARYSLTDVHTLKKYDDQTTAEFVRTHLTENIYQYIVRPGIEPFWYYSCEDASRALYTALTCQAIDAKFYTLRSGMDTLCRTLASKVSTRLGCTVKSIQHDSLLDLNAPPIKVT